MQKTTDNAPALLCCFLHLLYGFRCNIYEKGNDSGMSFTAGNAAIPGGLRRWRLD